MFKLMGKKILIILRSTIFLSKPMPMVIDLLVVVDILRVFTVEHMKIDCTSYLVI